MEAQTRPDGVLNRRQLHRLRDELGDPAAVDRFLGTFLDLLPSRLAEVGEIVRHGQRRPSDVATNLAAICEMIGADRLAGHLHRLFQGSLEAWTTTVRARYVQQASAEASCLRGALSHFLVQRQDARPPATRKLVLAGTRAVIAATSPEPGIAWSNVG
jgi:hypothetical protein